MNFSKLIRITFILPGLFWFFNTSHVLFAQQGPSSTEEVEVARTSAALLNAIQQRDAELNQKAEQINLREKRLQELKVEITRMLEKNAQLKNEIDKQQLEKNEKEEELLQRLAKIYQSMEPEEASRRIEKLKDPLALDILSRIKAKSVAAILTGMDPIQAAEYSEKLSQVKK